MATSSSTRHIRCETKGCDEPVAVQLHRVDAINDWRYLCTGHAREWEREPVWEQTPLPTEHLSTDQVMAMWPPKHRSASHSDWQARVEALEAEGLSTSDAQAVLGAEERQIIQFVVEETGEASLQEVGSPDELRYSHPEAFAAAVAYLQRMATSPEEGEAIGRRWLDPSLDEAVDYIRAHFGGMRSAFLSDPGGYLGQANLPWSDGLAAEAISVIESEWGLSYDEAEAAGLDGTGRDGNPGFPYTAAAVVTDVEPGTPEWEESERALGYAPKPLAAAGAMGHHGADDYQTCTDESHWERLPAPAKDPEWSGAQVLAAIAEATSLPAYIEQTGGGTATVYVGTPDAEGRYLLAAGPGSFNWADSGRSIFYPEDFNLGPDDDGEADADTCTTLGQITAAAARWIERLRPERSK